MSFLVTIEQALESALKSKFFWNFELDSKSVLCPDSKESEQGCRALSLKTIKIIKKGFIPDRA